MDFHVVEGEDRGPVELYALSSCAWCDKVKELLGRLGVAYRFVDADLLPQEEREEVIRFLDSITPDWGFPVLLIHEKYMLPGYKEKATRELLGFPGEEAPGGREPGGEGAEQDPEAEKAHDRLLRSSQKRGHFLNPRRAFARKLVRGLLANQERYGYWACPCRLASGNREEDRDIICPCAYMEPDVKEYGACYCGLYVSEDVARGEREPETVPERRKRRSRQPAA